MYLKWLFIPIVYFKCELIPIFSLFYHLKSENITTETIVGS